MTDLSSAVAKVAREIDMVGAILQMISERMTSVDVATEVNALDAAIELLEMVAKRAEEAALEAKS